MSTTRSTPATGAKRERMMDFCTQCGKPRTGSGFCASCGAPQPAMDTASQPASLSQSPNVAVPQPAQASGGHLVRNVLICVGLGLFVIVGLGIAGSVYAMHKAKEKLHELAQGTEA